MMVDREAGKGDRYRKYDRTRWSEFWKRYCAHYGHRFVNGICIYCEEVKEHFAK